MLGGEDKLTGEAQLGASYGFRGSRIRSPGISRFATSELGFFLDVFNFGFVAFNC